MHENICQIRRTWWGIWMYSVFRNLRSFCTQIIAVQLDWKLQFYESKILFVYFYTENIIGFALTCLLLSNFSENRMQFFLIFYSNERNLFLRDSMNFKFFSNKYTQSCAEKPALVCAYVYVCILYGPSNFYSAQRKTHPFSLPCLCVFRNFTFLKIL